MNMQHGIQIKIDVHIHKPDSKQIIYHITANRNILFSYCKQNLWLHLLWEGTEETPAKQLFTERSLSFQDPLRWSFPLTKSIFRSFHWPLSPPIVLRQSTLCQSISPGHIQHTHVTSLGEKSEHVH